MFVQRKAEGEHESSRRIKTQFLIEMEGCGSGSEQILLIGVYPFSYALLHFVLTVWIVTMHNAHVNSSTRPFCVKSANQLAEYKRSLSKTFGPIKFFHHVLSLLSYPLTASSMASFSAKA